jgi:pimeloyl-ACP methyl ester carboxylesterase
VPTLVTSGRHDECTPALVEPLHRGISGSEWVLFEESAHMPYLEEPERFLQVVGSFLDRVERVRPAGGGGPREMELDVGES